MDSTTDTRAQFVDDNPSARRERLINWFSAATDEAAGEGTIKSDGLGEVSIWKMRCVKGEGRREIVALCDGAVEEDRDGLIITTNGTAVKYLGLGGQA